MENKLHSSVTECVHLQYLSDTPYYPVEIKKQ